MLFDQVAPAVLGMSKSIERSDRYQFVSSKDILNTFEQNNWFVHDASQPRIHKKNFNKREFSKHLITFSNPDFKMVNGVIPRIVVINSHNGSSPFIMMAGLFRMVCSNGLIISDSTFEEIRIRHSALAPSLIESGIEDIIELVPSILGKTEEMNTVILNPVDQLDLATNIIERIWVDPKVRPLEASQIITSRRNGDDNPTLWNITNRIQENIVRGGLIGKTKTNKNRVQRGINNIEKNVKVNQLIWEEADTFLKAA